ncbi:MAG: hypothetical protein IJX55_00130 [Clostridia bacterium]|nr:hypothetical protein [Clostridia bacterium]
MKKTYKLISLLVCVILSFSSCSNANNTTETSATSATTAAAEFAYTLTLRGSMPNAEKESVIVVRTNNPDLTFEYVAECIFSSDFEKSQHKDFEIVSIDSVN